MTMEEIEKSNRPLRQGVQFQQPIVSMSARRYSGLLHDPPHPPALPSLRHWTAAAATGSRSGSCPLLCRAATTAAAVDAGPHSCAPLATASRFVRRSVFPAAPGYRVASRSSSRSIVPLTAVMLLVPLMVHSAFWTSFSFPQSKKKQKAKRMLRDEETCCNPCLLWNRIHPEDRKLFMNYHIKVQKGFLKVMTTTGHTADGTKVVLKNKVWVKEGSIYNGIASRENLNLRKYKHADKPSKGNGLFHGQEIDLIQDSEPRNKLVAPVAETQQHAVKCKDQKTAAMPTSCGMKCVQKTGSPSGIRLT